MQSLIDLTSENLTKKDTDFFKRGDIVFLKIFPEDLLILNDPYQFPEFSLLQLKDNCQTVALGKLYKVAYKDDFEENKSEKNSEKDIEENYVFEKIKNLGAKNLYQK